MSHAAHFVDDYLPALLAQAGQLLSVRVHCEVAAKGFTVSEWRVLSTLASREPLSIGQITQITVAKQPTITIVLDRMEARGLVKRIAHESDGRVTLVGITPVGARQVSGLIEMAREHEKRVLQPYGRQRVADLKAILKQLIEVHRGSAGDDTDV